VSAEIIHGDALDVLRGMPDASVDAVVTDPPYLNTGTGSSRASRVAAIPDERQFFDLWMRSLWQEFGRVLKPTGGLWMTIDWRGAVSCERAACGSPLTFGGAGVWAKDGLGMGYMLRHTYECFVVARMPEWERRTASESDVWRVKWTPTDRKHGHEAEKPVELMRRALALIAEPGGVVLDPFAGSGTTGVAAALDGYDFLGIEREAAYVDIARRRIADAQAQTGLALGAAG
jgi:site-specific DNA-methyltransferase (adenine-specific)